MDGKTALEQELQAQLDEWIAIVGRLRAKVENEHGDLRMTLMAEVDRLVAYQKRAETYVQELRDAPGDAWKGMTTQLDLARGEMRQALDRAWKRIEIKPESGAPEDGPQKPV
ncbi:MAG: hypothetical protein KJZ59_12780 [Pararhodobacter sp.]|nr:hypothetical protein [Pararhodobacter sp.]